MSENEPPAKAHTKGGLRHSKDWLGKGLSPVDKKSICSIIDADFERGSVDWSDDRDVQAACRTIISKMQEGNEYWQQLTPETMIMTTTKYSSLFEYVYAQFKKRNGNSPERQPGMASPEDKYPLAPTETEESSKGKPSAFKPFKSTLNFRDATGKGTPVFIPPTEVEGSSRTKPEEQIQMERAQDLIESTRGYMLSNFNLDINLLQEYKETAN